MYKGLYGDFSDFNVFIFFISSIETLTLIWELKIEEQES